MDYSNQRELLSVLNQLLAEEFERFKENKIPLYPTNSEVRLSNTRSSYGSSKRINGQFRQIFISKNLIDVADIEEVRSVIAHELAHSTLGSDGHDEVWRETVRKIRSSYDYLYADYHLCEHPYSTERKKAVHSKMREKEHKYMLECINCGHTYFYSKKSRAVQHPEKYKCGKCGGILVNNDRSILLKDNGT